MKVVIISFSGMERYTIQLANSLSKFSEVFVILECRIEFDFEKLFNSKVKYVSYRFNRLSSPSNLFLNINILKQIYRFNPDVIHYQATSPWFSMFLPFMRNYLNIVTFHDIQSHEGSYSLRSRIEKWIFRRNSNGIIVHGNKLREALIQKYNYDENWVEVIPHGNYDYFLAKAAKDSSEYSNYILFFGRIIEYKGLQYLIKAFPEILKRLGEIKLIIAGSGGDYLSYCKEIARGNENIIFIDRFIRDDEVGPLFKNCSIVIAPYVEASQSGVINIAYTFGKPVVATTVGSIPEIVLNNKTGLLIPPRSSKDISDAVVHLIKNNLLRNEMGKHGRRLSDTMFSWDNIAKKTFKFYNLLLN